VVSFFEDIAWIYKITDIVSGFKMSDKTLVNGFDVDILIITPLIETD